MYCRLYELEVKSGIKIADREECIEYKCEYYKGYCSIHEHTNIHVDKDTFGWLIDEKINFPGMVQSINGGSRYYKKLISLIHPTHDNIWIIKSLKGDKETDIYDLKIDRRNKGSYRTLEELNHKLKNDDNIDYHGRDITEEDLTIIKENV